MANISAIKLPNGTTYTLKDNGALQLTGGQVTGPVTFGDSVSIDEATLGDLVVNGSASFTNNIQANTINGVAVGNSPKFTDTDTKNTAGSTDSNSKLFLIGATSQAANPQTYSHDTAYVGTDGYLYSNSKKTLVEQYSNNGYNLNITPSISSSSADFTIQAALDNSGNFYETLYFGSDGFYISNDFDEKTWIRIDDNGTTPVSITGVKTPQEQYDAVNKLYVDSKHVTRTATLTTTWTSNQQTVTVSGVTSSNYIVVSPAPASYEAYCEAGIYCSAQGSNSLTFKCDTVPSAALTVNIMIVN